MIHFNTVQTVNFYGDPLDVGVTPEGEAFVSVSQITGYLGLDIESILERFDKDPRVSIDFMEDEAIISIYKLPGFLMLLPVNEVPEEFKDDLLRYQVECFEVLHDYWLHGIAINRRETPYDVKSKFKDERAVSREALTKACAKYCKDTDLDPSDLFDKLMGNSYKIIGLKPLHENEKLTGAQARYLAWVESVYAQVVNKFAVWEELPEDVAKEASMHVENHLRKTGDAWLSMADNVPHSLHHKS